MGGPKRHQTGSRAGVTPCWLTDDNAGLSEKSSPAQYVMAQETARDAVGVRREARLLLMVQEERWPSNHRPDMLKRGETPSPLASWRVWGLGDVESHEETTPWLLLCPTGTCGSHLSPQPTRDMATAFPRLWVTQPGCPACSTACPTL